MKAADVVIEIVSYQRAYPRADFPDLRLATGRN